MKLKSVLCCAVGISVLHPNVFPATNDVIKIEKSSAVNWLCHVGTNSKATVAFQLFHKTEETDRVFKDALKSQKAHLDWLEQQERDAKNERMRLLYKQEIKRLQSGDTLSATNWEAWPIVIPSRVISKKATPSRFLAACRSESKPVEVLILITSKNELPPKLVMNLIRKITAELDGLSEKEWASLPIRPGSVFDSSGAIHAEGIENILNDADYLEQK